jgi:prevent-host-death family protein
MKATAKELRIHAKELLDAVSRGEHVTITFRGKPYATLVPYAPSDPPSVKQAEPDIFGMWADRDDMESVEDYLQNARKSRFS